MSKKYSCNSECNCHEKKKKSNLEASAEEGCNKNSVENPKTAYNNQW